MKKTNKLRNSRIVLACLLTAAILAGSLVGCAKSNAPTESSAAPSEAASAASSDAASKAAVPFDETLEFTFFGAMWQPYSAEMTEITDELQKRTNTKITFEWTAVDTYQDKLSAVLASGKLPDIISYGTVKTAIDTLVDQGAVIPLDGLLAKYAPDYTAAVGENAAPYTKFAADGKTYAIRSIIDYKPMYSYMVRTDWVKNVGKTIPTDWNGWVELWKAFRDQDANMDGNKSNEVALGDYFDLRNIAYMCGIQKSENFALDANGNYSIVSEHPNYELFLDTARMLYSEKLLDQEYQTKKLDPDLFTIMDNNTCGTTYTYAERAKLSTEVNVDLNKDALWSSIIPVQGPNGDQLVGARPKFSLGTCITVGAEKAGKAEKLMQFLNYMYSAEGTQLINYGIEGKHYTLKDGVPVLNSPYIDGFVEARKAGLIAQVLPLNWQSDNYQMILLKGKTYQDLDAAGKSFVDGLTINNDYYFTVPPTFSTETIVKEGVNLFAKLDVLRDNYVTGKITKEEYKAEYAKLKAAGLDKINEEVKAAYNTVK